MLWFDIQEETEEEEILLQPIGPGMQNLEPEGSGTLRQRSLTPVFSPEQQGNKTVAAMTGIICALSTHLALIITLWSISLYFCIDRPTY